MIILEFVLLAVALDSQNIYGIIAWIIFNIVFAVLFVKNNWFWIRTMTDYMLGRATGVTFSNGKALFPKNKKKVKDDGKK